MSDCCVKCKGPVRLGSTRDLIISQYGEKRFIHSKCMFQCVPENLGKKLSSYFYVNCTKYYLFPESIHNFLRFKLCVDAVEQGNFCMCGKLNELFIRISYANTWRCLVFYDSRDDFHEMCDKFMKYSKHDRMCYYQNDACEIHRELNKHLSRKIHHYREIEKFGESKDDFLMMDELLPLESHQSYAPNVMPNPKLLKNMNDEDLQLLFSQWSKMSAETSRIFYEEGRRRDIGMDKFEHYVMKSSEKFLVGIFDELAEEEKDTVNLLGSGRNSDLCKKLVESGRNPGWVLRNPSKSIMNNIPEHVNWKRLMSIPKGCNYENVKKHMKEIPWKWVWIHDPDEVPDEIYEKYNCKELQRIMPERCIDFTNCVWNDVSKNPNVTVKTALKYWRQIIWSEYIRYHEIPNMVVEKLMSMSGITSS